MKSEISFPAASLAAALALALLAAPTAADQCINDDLIVDGSTCIGLDCVCNSEAFGFDTLRLKENNLRITFIDTSNSASFPRGDWQIRANESTNGGANEFAIDWLGTSATSGSGVVSTPFNIEGDAPSDSIYVDDAGRVGFKTAVPTVELHVRDGNSPTLRLEQDGSAGFTPQTWDVAGNETNFFVRDVTNGSTLPLRIRPNSPSNSIFVEGTTADVGFGTSAPEEPIHVRRTDASTTRIRVENANAATQVTGVQLTNNSASWQFELNGVGNFQISEDGSGGAEFVIDENAVGNQQKFRFANGATIIAEIQADGDVNNLTGVYGTLSDRNLKTDIRAVDPADVLARVAELPISTWRFKDHPDDVHLGPMAQDFWAAFGLYQGETSIALNDLSGVALAAIQGLDLHVESLNQEIAGLDEEIVGLNRALRAKDGEIRELRERLEAVEAHLATD